jgi:TonB family protein
MESRIAARLCMGISAWLIYAACCLIASPLLAQTIEESPPQKSDHTSVPIETFKAAQLRKHRPSDPDIYPRSEKRAGREGWVNVNFMVDPKGKPYEFTVIDSLGGVVFEKAAVESMANLRFEPASINGMPVDSAMTLKLSFSLQNAPRHAYLKTYDTFAQAVTKGDKSAADSVMRELQPRNLQEDVYYGFAQYLYAQAWGGEAQQLAGLRRALAYEHEQKLFRLPKAMSILALREMMRLQITEQDYAGALTTWDALKKTDIDEKVRAETQVVIDKIERFRVDDRSFSVNGRIDDRSWIFDLFKRRFRFKVTEGRIVEIKLRCERDYVFFRFDPEIEYKVTDKAGKCSIEAIGDTGTKFAFIQS